MSGILYENNINVADKNYLVVRLVGTKSNTDAIGAVVKVSASGRTQTKTLIAGSSYYSQDSTKLLFGLGDHASPVSIQVVWPSGNEILFDDVMTNKTIKIYEDGRLVDVY